jgi:hypothetical protein
LNVDNYAPALREITFPSLQFWAQKIGAEIKVIETRKWPEYPITYEKFQMYEMAKEDPADWHIFVDADAYVKNDMIDIVEYIGKDKVLVAKGGKGNLRFKSDNYMRRYGRHLDLGSWFFAFSDWTIDAFKPPHLQSGEPVVDELIANIYPQTSELNAKVPVEPSHLIDDYMLCRNIAKYGLNVVFMAEEFPMAINTLVHTCFDTVEAKRALMQLVTERDERASWSLIENHEWANDIKTRVLDMDRQKIMSKKLSNGNKA